MNYIIGKSDISPKRLRKNHSAEWFKNSKWLVMRELYQKVEGIAIRSHTEFQLKSMHRLREESSAHNFDEYVIKENLVSETFPS